MEASERLFKEDEAAVRAIDDRIVIERLEIEDERSARVVRERAEAGQPPARTVRDAIEIGARVLEREGTAAEVDYVRAELERAQAGFEKRGSELGERLAQGIQAGNESLAERIASAFGPDRSDSVQQQVKQIVAAENERARGEMLRLFTAEGGANPLGDFKGAITRAVAEAAQRADRESKAQREQIAALTEQVTRLGEREEADRRVAEAEDAGTRKGLDFEGRVHEALERIATARGDAATHTGGETAEGGGKKGDTLVELGAADGPAGGRMVFEAKDKRLSKNDAWAELNQSMAARAAAFGVLVVAGEDRVPAGRETLTEYEGNKMIVAVEREEPDGLMLEAAYRLARARVLMARDSELAVDAAAVRDAAQEAVSILKQAQAIRSSLTGIKTSSDKARDGLNAMVDAVQAKLDRIDSLVASDEPEPTA